MQIVIDIPESRYSLLKKQASTPLGREKLDEFAEAVLNGTPLHKGHGRLKDVDRLEPHDEYDGQGFTKSIYQDDIDNLPTIIEADKVKGEEREEKE